MTNHWNIVDTLLSYWPFLYFQQLGEGNKANTAKSERALQILIL